MKELLRKGALEKRRRLSEKEIFEKSRAISEKVLSLQEVKRAKTISCYINIGSEVKTRPLISKLLGLGKIIVVPAVSEERKKMQMCRILSLNETEKKNAFFEPSEECKRVFPSKKIDLVLVPGTAFDPMGYRLGYGKGYYDKFLRTLAKQVPFIGLAFECQLVQAIPAEEHDVRLDKIVTEKRIIEC